MRGVPSTDFFLGSKGSAESPEYFRRYPRNSSFLSSRASCTTASLSATATKMSYWALMDSPSAEIKLIQTKERKRKEGEEGKKGRKGEEREKGEEGREEEVILLGSAAFLALTELRYDSMSAMVALYCFNFPSKVSTRSQKNLFKVHK